MATLLIKGNRVVLSVALRDYSGDVDLKNYLADNLPDARCSFAIGSSGPNGSYDEYIVSVDSVQEPVLLLTLRDFCKENNLTHQIDIVD